MMVSIYIRFLDSGLISWDEWSKSENYSQLLKMLLFMKKFLFKSFHCYFHSGLKGFQ